MVEGDGFESLKNIGKCFAAAVSVSGGGERAGDVDAGNDPGVYICALPPVYVIYPCTHMRVRSHAVGSIHGASDSTFAGTARDAVDQTGYYYNRPFVHIG